MNDDPSSQSSPSRRSETVSPSTPPNGNLFDRLLSWFRPSQNADLRTDLEDALADEQSRDSDFSPEERSMLRNILRLRETRAEDVMVQRGDIIAVDQDTSLGLVLAKLRSSGHSRMPVFDDTLDQPIGLVHIKDVVAYLIDKTQGEPQSARARARARKADPHTDDVNGQESASKLMQVKLQDSDLDIKLSELAIVRQLLFVPASMPATDLMAQMQANRVQMALVIDEYGGTDGLISLEDLIETVVGDIEDEHDDEVAPIFEAIGDGGYLADARIPLEEVQAVFTEVEVDEEDADDVDTLGGLVFTALGRIPVRGELIDAVVGLDIEITDADPRRIKGMKVYPAGLRRRDPRGGRRPVRGGASTTPSRPDETRVSSVPNGALSGHDQAPKSAHGG